VAVTHEELIRPRVMAAVADLAARRASGVLEITGNPSGAIYLDGGSVTFARASWVPGLVARIRGGGPSPAGLAELLAGRDPDDTAIAALAVRQGYLAVARLHELIWSIVVDSFLVLTIPLAADSPVAAIRFASTRAHWDEIFPRFAIEPVRREAFRRAERITDYGLSPTTAVTLRDLAAPAAVITREQWAIACLIGEHASSARDLALRSGTAVTETIDHLGGLIRAGLCRPAVPPALTVPVTPVTFVAASAAVPAQASAIASDLTAPAGVAAAIPAEDSALTATGPLPMRRQMRDVTVRPGSPGQPPSMDILGRVLGGLRRLT
jgi:hypothetical protein